MVKPTKNAAVPSVSVPPTRARVIQKPNPAAFAKIEDALKMIDSLRCSDAIKELTKSKLTKFQRRFK